MKKDWWWRYENVPHSMCAAEQTKQNNLVTCEEWACVEDITTILPPITNHIVSMQTHENLLDVWREYKPTAALIWSNRACLIIQLDLWHCIASYCLYTWCAEHTEVWVPSQRNVIPGKICFPSGAFSIALFCLPAAISCVYLSKANCISALIKLGEYETEASTNMCFNISTTYSDFTVGQHSQKKNRNSIILGWRVSFILDYGNYPYRQIRCFSWAHKFFTWDYVSNICSCVKRMLCVWKTNRLINPIWKNKNVQVHMWKLVNHNSPTESHV